MQGSSYNTSHKSTPLYPSVSVTSCKGMGLKLIVLIFLPHRFFLTHLLSYNLLYPNLFLFPLLASQWQISWSCECNGDSASGRTQSTPHSNTKSPGQPDCFELASCRSHSGEVLHTPESTLASTLSAMALSLAGKWLALRAVNVWGAYLTCYGKNHLNSSRP